MKQGINENLAKIFGGRVFSRFSEELWERSPAIWRELDSPLQISTDEIAEMLKFQIWRQDDLRLAIDGEEIDLSKMLDARGFIQPSDALRAFKEGSTLILRNFDRRHSSARDICDKIETLLGHAVMANLYATPRASQGFSLHQDFHDVFVWQLSGSKLWKVHSQKSLPSSVSKTYPQTVLDAGPIVLETELTSGDVLYIPRGCHHAAAAGDRESVHLTIGVHTTKWIDLLHVLLEQLEVGNEVLRRSLPIVYLSEEVSLSKTDAWKEISKLLLQMDAQDGKAELNERMEEWVTRV